MRRSIAAFSALFLLAFVAAAAAQSPGVAAPPLSAPVKAAPALSPEQQETIRGIVKNAKVDHVAKMQFTVEVGAEVPRNLHFYPFPKEVAESVPEYGAYFYVVVAEKIVVIDPVNYRIVAILAA